MKTKRTQQEIIVTVLLVLIAIAAVILISNYVINMVKDNTAKGQGKLDCIGVDLTINRAIATENGVLITRNVGTGTVNITNIKILIDGIAKNSTDGNLQIFETKNFTFDVVASEVRTPIDLSTGQKVSAVVTLAGGTVCDPKGEVTVA
jgi:hypothetical protein